MHIPIFSPKSTAEALRLLQSPGGLILAGGTDLVIALRREEKKPDYLVDIGNINDLKHISIEANEITLGAAVTFSDIIQNHYIQENIPALKEAALKMGACQIQNRATIGGNICNAAPAADSIPLLMALDAQCILASTQGKRVLPIRQFVLEKGKTALENGEMLEAIRFNKMREGEGCGFAKLGKRKALAISVISCAVRIKTIGETIKEAHIFTGSLGSKAMEEKRTEQYLTDKKINRIYIDEAAQILSQEVYDRLGNRASADYKTAAVKGVFKEAYNKALYYLKL